MTNGRQKVSLNNRAVGRFQCTTRSACDDRKMDATIFFNEGNRPEKF
jgi:hypothetical protein